MKMCSTIIISTLGTITSVANIATKGVLMKEEPIVVSHSSKFSVLITKSSFINLCDSFDENDCSLPNVIVVLVNLQADEELLWMEVPQAAIFSIIIDLLNAMFMTMHTCFELKSLDYGAITIVFVNYFLTKFNGDILFELPLIRR